MTKEKFPFPPVFDPGSTIIGIYPSSCGFSAPAFTSLLDPWLSKDENTYPPVSKSHGCRGPKKLIFRSIFFHLKTNQRIQKFEHLEYSSGVKLTKFNISSDLNSPHSARTVYTMTVIFGHQVPTAKANKVISFLSHFVTWPNPSHTSLSRP